METTTQTILQSLANLSVPVILVFLLLVSICLILGIMVGRLIQKSKDKSLMESSRADAIKRSRAVLGGQFSEQVAPFLPGFPCNPGDVRFVGKPVDFIAFPGSAQGKPIEKIQFIEVKSGESQLSAREREIKRAVENGSIEYVVYRIP
jgi:predicted Holliday junction resolvase-like endonuclease